MKVMICSYDVPTAERLERVVSELGYETILHIGLTSKVLESLKSHRPEILLLHISVAEVAQVRTVIAKSASYNPAFVVIGKKEACDITLFKLGVQQYLVPPVAKEELGLALKQVSRPNAAQVSTLNRKPEGEKRVRQYVAARTHRGVELVPLNDVYYFVADQKYVKVRHKNGVVLVDETLKELESEFGDTMFRIHRGALVNLDYLDLLELVDTGQCQVHFRGIDERLPVSRRHLPALRDKITNF